MVGVVEGFRWALLGTAACPRDLIAYLHMLVRGSAVGRRLLLRPGGAQLRRHHLIGGAWRTGRQSRGLGQELISCPWPRVWLAAETSSEAAAAAPWRVIGRGENSRHDRLMLGRFERRLVRYRPGRSRRHHRPQRRRQEHPAEDAVADHRADTGATLRSDGRVGSLLEVGTGFHPELTGRENIFLNGAILGMTPQQRSSGASTRSSPSPKSSGSSIRR